MSAFTQNFVYKFGKIIPGSKENVMPKERLEAIRKSAEKYMAEAKYEYKKNSDK